MKTIIAGSRTALYSHVESALKRCAWTGDITEVVSGCAVGADRCGEWYAAGHNADAPRHPLTLFPADWSLGKSAGVIRNRQMAEYADALVAVWDGKSPGTRNMIYEARKRGLTVFIWDFVNQCEMKEG